MSRHIPYMHRSSEWSWSPKGVPLVTAMQDASRRDKICTLIQVGAYPLIGILLAIGMCLYQWLG